MENDMKLIACGKKPKEVVLKECISEMKKIFIKVFDNSLQMRDFLK